MPAPQLSLPGLLRALKLPTFARLHEEIGHKAEQEGWSFAQYLRHLAILEVEERRHKRIAKNLKRSQLLGEKTLATLRLQDLAAPVAKRLPTLCEGTFIDRGDNVLIFGLPGRGKSRSVRTIIAFKDGERAFFMYGFFKNERSNIDRRELEVFKKISNTLLGQDDSKLNKALKKKDLIEVS